MNPLKVIFQHKDIVIVDKPSGWTVYPEDGSDQAKNMLSIVREAFGHEVYPVHRLDKGTSGILVFARNQRTAKDLQDLFAKHRVKKIYQAMVYGHAPEKFSSKEKISHKEKKDLSAETKYELISKGIWKKDIEVSLLRCIPKSGRFHQIRQHLKSAGFPVIGDSKNDKKNDLMLAAVEIEFNHPKSGERITISRGKNNRVSEFWGSNVKKADRQNS